MMGMDGARCKMHKCDVLVVIGEHVAVRAAPCENPCSLKLFSFVDYMIGSRNLVKCSDIVIRRKSLRTQKDHQVHTKNNLR